MKITIDTHNRVRLSLQSETQILVERLSAHLRTPFEDIVSIAAHAGIHAMAEAVKQGGGLTLPVQAVIAPQGMKVVFVPGEGGLK